ncbi:MAG: hypothetical protein R3355_11595 [Pseudomonas sp.]|uniref:hypothetical protein n=1 Tax=Pseudomonas sp. TaxID=306 RepID=UPI00299EE385|nr:hypothetical protein [Pseudomonas sp.]MDX1723729.1 hypothetical protein [Pseudomonas sp.]
MRGNLKLNEGDTLVQESHRSKGPLAETDIYTYSIVNAQGEKVGSVVHVDHTSIKGFNRSQSVEQRDISGNLVVDVRW